MPKSNTSSVSRTVQWLFLFSLLQVGYFQAVVQAQHGAIYMKNGGVINGEVMEVMPQQYATIKLADGTIRRVEWNDVERVDAGQKAQEPAPVQLVAQAPAAPSPTPSIKYEQRTTHGVPGMFIPGFIIFGIGWITAGVIGPIISANRDDTYNDYGYGLSSSSGTAAGVDIAASWIPVIGPWIGLASSSSRVSDGFWIAAGLAQDIGITLAIAGLVMKRTRTVPVYASDDTNKATVAYLLPGPMGHGGAGLSLRVVHY